MRMVVESMKRLYNDKKITESQLLDRVSKNILSPDEYDYILGIDKIETIEAPSVDPNDPVVKDLLENYAIGEDETNE